MCVVAVVLVSLIVGCVIKPAGAVSDVCRISLYIERYHSRKRSYIIVGANTSSRKHSALTSQGPIIHTSGLLFGTPQEISLPVLLRVRVLWNVDCGSKIVQQP